MNIKKALRITVVTLVSLNLAWGLYKKHEASEHQKNIEASFKEYFEDDDERIKMTWFSANGTTIAIALELSGIGVDLNDMEKIKSNSRKYVYEKACNSPEILNFLSEGNQMSVDIRNADMGTLKNIMNLHITKSSCV